MTELAFGALVVAAVAWTVGNTGIAGGAASLTRFVFVIFLAIAAILFAFAVLGVSVPSEEHLSPPHAAGRCSGKHRGPASEEIPFVVNGERASRSLRCGLSIVRKREAFKGEVVHGKPENVPSASIVRERLWNRSRPVSRASGRHQRGARLSYLPQFGPVSKGASRNPVAERTAVSQTSIAG